MSTYPLTTSLKVVKELQWVKETIEGSTPSSPTFVAIPTNEFILITKVRRDNKFRKLGSADLTRVIESTEDYDISISYAPIALNTLLYSMVNLIGSSGNRENSFTFLISQQHNNAGVLTEMYQIARGCKISSVKITVTNGQLVNIQSKWLAMSASDWSITHGLSGTPSFANALTGTPWAATTTGASPLTFGGNSYDIRNFSVTINHNTDRTRVLDEIGSVRLQPQIRDIAIEIDVVYKNTVISQDVRTLTPRSMIMNIHVEPGEIYDLEFSNVYLESYDETIDAKSKDAKVISYTGYATFVTLELVSSGNIVRALPTETVSISDSLAKLVHIANIVRAVPIQTVLISDSVTRIKVSAGTKNVVKNLPTEIITISETPAMKRLAAKLRPIAAQTTILSDTRTRLATKARPLSTQTISLSESVARLKTPGAPSGPTRLYFHAIINSTSGLPTAEQSTQTSNFDLEGSQTTNRQMNTTIGTSQQVISRVGGTTASSQTIYITRFVSPPLNQSSIAANTWTLSVAFKEDNTSNNFPVSGTDRPLWVNCFVWRPSTSSKIGTILNGNTLSTVDEGAAGVERASTVTFAGSAVASMQNGDVIIIEIWNGTAASTRTTSTIMYFYYDGATVTTTDGTVSNHASFLQTPQGLIFS